MFVRRAIIRASVLESTEGRHVPMRRSLVILALVAALAVGTWRMLAPDKAEPVPLAERYRLATLERGSLEQTVSANGTLNPVTVVNVGTQISGTIRSVNTDFNRSVVRGQLLAEIDPSLIEAQLAQLEANLQELQTQLRLAQRRLERSENLVARGFISGAQLDDDRQALESLQARMLSAQAQIGRERTNLGYTKIRSPIDGVVIARSVDVGQTVAASFQTPTLFMIARDLRDMQIDTNVAEADVGALREGLKASFTVDALGERAFEARVRQIRLNPKIEQNVVTYNVVLATRNDDGRLLPGMTASVRIRVAAKADVLRVPNTALRFRPSDPESVRQRQSAPSAPGRPGEPVRRRGVLHVESSENGQAVLVRVPVTVGITDGAYTEIADDGAVKAGDRVVTGELVRQPRSGSSGGSFRMRLF